MFAMSDAVSVLKFAEIRAEDLPRVGGKGANLGEMTAAGLPIPDGFCVTTAAYARFIAQLPEFDRMLDALDRLDFSSPRIAAAVVLHGQAIRSLIEAAPVDDETVRAILELRRQHPPDAAFAVRSSATAEDLPSASFAGQQDTYLNVRGEEALIDAVRRCWASLFTDRAITYRARNGFDHRRVELAVVVQLMVQPESAGIAFSADPISGNREVIAIDAGFGLGEALVSGISSADLYRLDKRTLAVLECKIAAKQKAIRSLPDGGTIVEELDPELGAQPALDDASVRRLAEIVRRIEQHYGCPQDIEWAFAGGVLYILQSRPITSLYPLPEPAPSDDRLHVYLSMSHAQVMTDAMKPFGEAVFRTFLPFGRRGARPSPYTAGAGGRVYLDVTDALAFGPSRKMLYGWSQMVDPLIHGGLVGFHERHPGRASWAHRLRFARFLLTFVLPRVAQGQRLLWFANPTSARNRANARAERLIAGYRSAADGAGSAADQLELALELITRATWDFAGFMPFVMAGQLSLVLLGKLLGREATDPDLVAVARGVPGSVAVELELACGDLANTAHALPGVAEAILAGQTRAAIAALPDGARFDAALSTLLERFGARGPGEIDASRCRYREEPGILLSAVATALRKGEPGGHRRYHEELARLGEEAGRRLVEAGRRHGRLREWLVARLVRAARGLLGVRELPKFVMIHTVDFARRSALRAGEALVAQGHIARAEDAMFLDSLKLLDALRRPDTPLQALVDARRRAWEHVAALTPPRVLTSAGERFEGHREWADLPEGALGGTAASAGIIEGRVRVVLDPANAQLEPGEILVAPYTDPGWTPLFLHAGGLVMEVGGLMTHGSVVAREYGLPAVVCVPDATTRLRTGQRVRVNGDQGWVEPLDYG